MEDNERVAVSERGATLLLDDGGGVTGRVEVGGGSVAFDENEALVGFAAEREEPVVRIAVLVPDPPTRARHNTSMKVGLTSALSQTRSTQYFFAFGRPAGAGFGPSRNFLIR